MTMGLNTALWISDLFNVFSIIKLQPDSNHRRNSIIERVLESIDAFICLAVYNLI